MKDNQIALTDSLERVDIRKVLKCQELCTLFFKLTDKTIKETKEKPFSKLKIGWL